jgi:hypothetical protein
MSEKIFTLGAFGECGYTYHVNRDILVVWHPDGAKRVDPSEVSDIDVSWLNNSDGSNIVKIDGPTETW